MNSFEAIAKALIWRFFIAIPLTLIVGYYYTHSLSIAMGITISGNVMSTIFYYLFDMAWFEYISKYFREKDEKH
jgi:uncharacterized membrane protein